MTLAIHSAEGIAFIRLVSRKWTSLANSARVIGILSSVQSRRAGSDLGTVAFPRRGEERSILTIRARRNRKALTFYAAQRVSNIWFVSKGRAVQASSTRPQTIVSSVHARWTRQHICTFASRCCIETNSVLSRIIAWRIRYTLLADRIERIACTRFVRIGGAVHAGTCRRARISRPILTGGTWRNICTLHIHGV